ncbi:MAG: DinB family protein [Phycisphaeraceae bacterium]|nr:DinB family protein [Phycisphaeraceae bacterium]
MGSIANAIVPAGNLSLRYAEMLLKDIRPADFARFPAPGGKPVHTNHPAFVYGHLAMYPQRVLEMLGQPKGLTATPADWDGLFKAGVECKDDPNGTSYPTMEKLVSFHRAAYEAALAAVSSASDAQLSAPNPGEGRMKEMFPTVGAVCNFIVAAHPMSHYGQVSAWRRCMGLGSAM